MGGSSSKIKHQVGVLVVGLDGAGKTALLATALDEDARTVMPTLGFMVRGLQLSDGTQLKVYDVGGRRDVRDHWRVHYEKVRAIIFVIDAVDRHRLQENSVELRRLLNSMQLVGVPILFLANKQDLAGALPASELEACLHLHNIRDRPWNCVGCSALRGDGFVRGLKWLAGASDPMLAGKQPTLASKRPRTPSKPSSPTKDASKAAAPGAAPDAASPRSKTGAARAGGGARRRADDDSEEEEEE